MNFFGCVLFFQASRLNQEYEGTCAAVHDRNFGGRKFDVGVIDAQAGHGRQQVLDRIHLDVAIEQRRRERGFTHIFNA